MRPTKAPTERCAWCGRKGQHDVDLFAARRFLDALRKDGHCQSNSNVMHLSCGTDASRVRLGLLNVNRQYDTTLARVASH